MRQTAQKLGVLEAKETSLGRQEAPSKRDTVRSKRNLGQMAS